MVYGRLIIRKSEPFKYKTVTVQRIGTRKERKKEIMKERKRERNKDLSWQWIVATWQKPSRTTKNVILKSATQCISLTYWMNKFSEHFQKCLTNQNIVFLLFGDSSASEFYVPTFRNTLLHLHRVSSSYDLWEWNHTAKVWNQEN